MGENHDLNRDVSTRIVDISELMRELQERTRILLVDDELMVLSTMERQVRSLGYEVVTAISGEEALEELQNHEITVVVADQNMPNMSGVELLRQVREQYPTIVRVMTTGNGDLDFAIAAINQGEVFRILAKPWGIEDLQRILEAAVADYQISVENEIFKNQIRSQNEELIVLTSDLERRVEERAGEVVKQAKHIQGLYQELDQSFNAMLDAMIAVTTVGEPRISKHSRATQECAGRFSRFLGVNPQVATMVSRAAMMHWIGLVNAPSKIFRVPIRDFGDDESVVWDFHPVLAANAIQGIPALVDVAEVVANYLEPANSEHYRTEDQRLACQILRICSGYERCFYVGQKQGHNDPASYALEYLQIAKQNGAVDVELADGFLEFISQSPSQVREETSVHWEDLLPGMVFSRPITTGTGAAVVTSDVVVTPEIKAQIRELASKGLEEIWIWRS